MEALHLTEANKAVLRDLVRKITPHFEEEMWEKINLHREEEERKKHELEELSRQYAQQQAVWAQQAQQQGQWVQYGSPSTIITTGTTCVSPGALAGIGSVVAPVTFGGLASTNTTAITTPGFTSYVSGSTLPDEMGLLKRGGGWTDTSKK